MINSNPNSSVIIALSDVPTLTIISYHLERLGFVVNTVNNTDGILDTIERIDPSILILDEDLTGQQSPINICSLLKNNPRTKEIKIIFASKNENLAKENFNEFLTKPFVPSHLFKKISNLSNNKNVVNQSKRIITYHDIEMNVTNFRVIRNGRIIHLGPNEFKIFQCFLEHPGKTLSREHIINYVWGHNDQVEPRTIDVHINRLRTALKNNELEAPLIKTIRSSGYALSAPRELIRT
jgi:two-component system phosphate regulon response regulator PhoB